jgi:hypothetical protein
MSETSGTVVTGPGPLYVCACCGDHDDMPLVWGPPATCPSCGGPCSCEGCHADSESREETP